jgi:hypothetical protein
MTPPVRPSPLDSVSGPSSGSLRRADTICRHQPRRPNGGSYSAALATAMWSVLLGSGWTPTASAGFVPAPGACEVGFIENRGQVDQSVRYLLPGSTTDVYFLADGLMIDLKEQARRPEPDAPGARPPGGASSALRAGRGCAVLVRFAGGKPSPVLTAQDRLGATYNYFLGSDPTAWRSEVPAFSRLIYQDVWPGIDLIFREDRGALTYEAVVRPGAQWDAAGFAYDGAVDVRPEGADAERVETSAGTMIHERRGLSGRFFRDTERRAPASVARDNPGALRWSTFLGGNVGEQGTGVDLDHSGNAVVTGATLSSDFPTTPGAYDRSPNGRIDIIVAKISASGNALLWSTLIGGGFDDEGHALVLDTSDNVFITGHTASPDWPVTPGAYDVSFNGAEDAIVAKLSASGGALWWSTFMGGSSTEEGHSITLDRTGNAVLVGATFSTNFPTTPGAYQTSNHGANEAFAAALSSDGSALLWSTFLGGSGNEACWKLVLDASDNVAMTGQTSSSDFPATTGAYSTSFNGGNSDAFAALLSSSGRSLLWSTFLGGSGDESGYSVALDGSGDPVLTGGTNSVDFPTTPGAYDRSFNGGDDTFVAKLSSYGSALVWSTFLGGSGSDVSSAIVLGPSASPIVVGATGSIDFPTTPGGFDASWNGWVDVFAVSLTSAGNHLLWSTFLGGSGADYGSAIVLDASENPVVTGVTGSSDFPVTPGAYDASANGSLDIYVLTLDGGAMTTAVGTGADVGSDPVTRFVPNPTMRGGALRLTMDESEPLIVDIFDSAGRLIRTLPEAGPGAGRRDVFWDGRDEDGAFVTSGVYFYVATTLERVKVGTGKLVVDR